MRTALLLAALLAAQTAAATMRPGPPQELVRRARDIGEVVARSAYNEYQVTRVWKGSLPETLVLPVKGSASGQFVPGRHYVVLLHESRRPEIVGDEAAAAILQYLTAPRRVTAGDLVRMLRGWNHGTVTDESMLRWLRDTLPVAEVDDWAVIDEEEVSPVLRIMEHLEFSMQRFGTPHEELTCEDRVLRERVAPLYIRALETSALELLDEELVELEKCR